MPGQAGALRATPLHGVEQADGKFGIVVLDGFGEIGLHFCSARFRPKTQIAHGVIELATKDMLQRSRKKSADHLLGFVFCFCAGLQALDFVWRQVAAPDSIVFIFVTENSRAEFGSCIHESALADAEYLFGKWGAGHRS
jgi:hypothetical protein